MKYKQNTTTKYKSGAVSKAPYSKHSSTTVEEHSIRKKAVLYNNLHLRYSICDVIVGRVVTVNNTTKSFW